jgi:hypothetical protein
MHLGSYIATAQVEDEEPFQVDAALLDRARHHNHDNHNDADGYQYGTGELAQMVADIENEVDGYDGSY